MTRLGDMSGHRYGRLLAIRRDRLRTGGKAYWTCLCDCGQITSVRRDHLLKSLIRSCGCLNSQLTACRNYKHGATGTPEFESWRHMLVRCFNPRAVNFHNYGGRGITVCDEWRDDFGAFLSHIGPKPSSLHTVDRIDPNGNYEPGNVRWATPSEQRQNTRLKAHVT